jgi:hypothetical protein
MFGRNTESFGFPEERTETPPENTQEKKLDALENIKGHWDSLLSKLKSPNAKTKAFLMSSLALLAISSEQGVEARGHVPLNENVITSQVKAEGFAEEAQTITIEEAREVIDDEQFLEIFDRESNKVMELAFEEQEGESMYEHREANLALNDSFTFEESSEGNLPETLESARLEATTYLTDVTSNEHDFSGFANVIKLEKTELPENYESVTLQLAGYSYVSREAAILEALRSGAEYLGVHVDTSSQFENLEQSGENSVSLLENRTSSRTEAHIVHAEVDGNFENETPHEEGGLYLVQITVEFAKVEQPTNSSQ